MSYSIYEILAILTVIAVGLGIWLQGSRLLVLLFPAFPAKYTWVSYLSGIFLIPLVFMMQFGPFGFVLAIAEGSARKLSTHFDPKRGDLWVNLFYGVAIGSLTIHRLLAGF